MQLSTRGYAVACVFSALIPALSGCGNEVKPKSQVEVLASRTCALATISMLGLDGPLLMHEYVNLANTYTLQREFEGYLRIESERLGARELGPVANTISAKCLPDQSMTINMPNSDPRGAIVGKDVAHLLRNSSNHMIVISADDEAVNIYAEAVI